MEEILREQGEYMLTKRSYLNLNRVMYYVYRIVGTEEDGQVKLIGFSSLSKESAERIYNKCIGA